MRHKRIVFSYPQALSYSGQTAATLLAIEQLKGVGWECVGVEFAALDRTKPAYIRYPFYLFGQLSAWLQVMYFATRRSSIFCFNHSQSLSSFLRMGLPHLALRWLLPKRKIVSSLHGNLFLEWPHEDRNWRFMRRLMLRSDLITVLGEAQRAGLLEMGVPNDKILTLKNAVDVPLTDPTAIIQKHQDAAHGVTPITLLHLSLLIESKGYPVFLEASRKVAISHPKTQLKVVLCGPMAFTPYCSIFTTKAAKAGWINAQIEQLNALPNVDAEWIEGATGAAKSALFAKAHCFVFPSRFPVEAQPLVLIEAMASGCAIITSDQGEIATTVTGGAGQILYDVSVDSVAQALTTYVGDHAAREAAALNGLSVVHDSFSVSAYLKNWDTLLLELETRR